MSEAKVPKGGKEEKGPSGVLRVLKGEGLKLSGSRKEVGVPCSILSSPRDGCLPLGLIRIISNRPGA